MSESGIMSHSKCLRHAEAQIGWQRAWIHYAHARRPENHSHGHKTHAEALFLAHKSTAYSVSGQYRISSSFSETILCRSASRGRETEGELCEHACRFWVDDRA